MPNVFIGGKHVGGCDSTPLIPLILTNPILAKPQFVEETCVVNSMTVLLCVFFAETLEKHQQGQLVPMLTDAGAIATKSAQLTNPNVI